MSETVDTNGQGPHIKNAPAIIFLTLNCDGDESVVDFNSLSPESVLWSPDRIELCDLKYALVNPSTIQAAAPKCLICRHGEPLNELGRCQATVQAPREPFSLSVCGCACQFPPTAMESAFRTALLAIKNSQESDLGEYARFCHDVAAKALEGAGPLKMLGTVTEEDKQRAIELANAWIQGLPRANELPNDRFTIGTANFDRLVERISQGLAHARAVVISSIWDEAIRIVKAKQAEFAGKPHKRRDEDAAQLDAAIEIENALAAAKGVPQPDEVSVASAELRGLFPDGDSEIRLIYFSNFATGEMAASIYVPVNDKRIELRGDSLAEAMQKVRAWHAEQKDRK